MDKIYKLLNASKPVYIRGSNMGNSSGHAWIIDGYLNCERDVVITETSGYNPRLLILDANKELCCIVIGDGRGQEMDISCQVFLMLVNGNL